MRTEQKLRIMEIMLTDDGINPFKLKMPEIDDENENEKIEDENNENH